MKNQVVKLIIMFSNYLVENFLNYLTFSFFIIRFHSGEKINSKYEQILKGTLFTYYLLFMTIRFLHSTKHIYPYLFL